MSREEKPLLLFDLDGTLVDSAPDLAGTVNDMLQSRGRPALPYAGLRHRAGSGARGMIAAAFAQGPGDEGYVALRDEFHDRYAQRMLLSTMVFDPVAPMLDALDAAGVVWGIVTNKAMRFAGPLTEALGLRTRARVLIAGDTTPHAKPHPAPLLEAARRLQADALRCVYIGDDHRDIVAGQAAGMAAWAAAWGYLGDGPTPDGWGADRVLSTPQQVLQSLELA